MFSRYFYKGLCDAISMSAFKRAILIIFLSSDFMMFSSIITEHLLGDTCLPKPSPPTTHLTLSENPFKVSPRQPASSSVPPVERSNAETTPYSSHRCVHSELFHRPVATPTRHKYSNESIKPSKSNRFEWHTEKNIRQQRAKGEAANSDSEREIELIRHSFAPE